MGIDHLSDLAALIGRYPLDRVSAIKFRVNLGIRCDSPKLIERYARPASWEAYTTLPNAKRGTVRFKQYASDEDANHPLWVEMEVPCRRCPSCLRLRAARWRARAIEEYKASSRTWFCTFTLEPHEQALAIWRARDRLAKRSLSFEELSADAQFAEQVRAISPAITKYLKRVRKATSARIRFIWVAERHKTGYPHFHALIHETDPACPVRKSVLREQWRLGFSTFKLVDSPRAASYLCKYLSKELSTRVRSSLGYGNITLRGNERVGPDLWGKKRISASTHTDLKVTEQLPAFAQSFDIMETF